MTSVDILDFFKWIGPAVPMLFEAMKKGQPIESLFAVDSAIVDAAFRKARQTRAKRAASRVPPTDED